jgi:hypothetical protein
MAQKPDHKTPDDVWPKSGVRRGSEGSKANFEGFWASLLEIFNAEIEGASE